MTTMPRTDPRDIAPSPRGLTVRGQVCLLHLQQPRPNDHEITRLTDGASPAAPRGVRCGPMRSQSAQGAGAGPPEALAVTPTSGPDYTEVVPDAESASRCFAAIARRWLCGRRPPGVIASSPSPRTLSVHCGTCAANEPAGRCSHDDDPTRTVGRCRRIRGQLLRERLRRQKASHGGCRRGHRCSIGYRGGCLLDCHRRFGFRAFRASGGRRLNRSRLACRRRSGGRAREGGRSRRDRKVRR